MIRASAKTRLYALLGDPVAHSLSPSLHNAAFREAGIDAAYLAVRCDSVGVAALVGAIARAGGGGNITVPHKQRVLSALDEPTDAVRRTGACNTFWLEKDRVMGDNTDVEGFTSAARALLDPLAGTRVLLLGAGGAASAVICALIAADAREVFVLNRSRARAEALRARYADAAARIAVVEEHADLRAEAFDLVVNATSLGMVSDDPLPLDLRSLGGARAALDLVYGSRGTRWVETARELGIPAGDGAGMLLAQAAAAFRRWTGREAPVAAMRAALQDAVRLQTEEGAWD